MKNTGKRLLSLVLTVAMLLSMVTGLATVSSAAPSMANAKTVEVGTTIDFWKALDAATKSKEPTIIKLTAKLSPTETVTDHDLLPNLKFAADYPKFALPDTCQVDVNGFALTLRALNPVESVMTREDSFIDSAGKGSVTFTGWNGVATSLNNACDIAAVCPLVKTINITSAVSQKTKEYVIPSGVTLSGSGVSAAKEITVQSGAIITAKALTATSGVTFECATTDDITQEGIKFATTIKLMADVRAADLVIDEGKILDLNGFTLSCRSCTVNGTLKENGGKIITGVSPYDLTPLVPAPENKPVEKPAEVPADAKLYTVVDFIQADGVDDYIDLGFAPKQYTRLDLEVEPTDLVRDVTILGASYTQEEPVETTTNVPDNTFAFGLYLMKNGTYNFRYRTYTAWNFNYTDLDFAEEGNTASGTSGATQYNYAKYTRASFILNYWLQRAASVATRSTGTKYVSYSPKFTSQMTPYVPEGAEPAETRQIGSKTAASSVTKLLHDQNINLYLFADHSKNVVENTDGPRNFAPARLYNLRVYESSATGGYKFQTSYLPVLNENDEAGLLELTTGKFYGNGGTGNMIYGTALGELAVGGTYSNSYIYSSGAAEKFLAAYKGCEDPGRFVGVGNPVRVQPLSLTYPELRDSTRWSYLAVRSAVTNGLMQGSNGSLRLSSYITRAEAATIITRAFGNGGTADLSAYPDVRDTDWFKDSMAQAVYMGILNGSNGWLLPNNNITREQVFAILARALNLPDHTYDNLSQFADAASVSSWAVPQVAAMVKGGYVSGSNGKLNPLAYITREEFAQVIYNVLRTYVTKDGTYTEADAKGGLIVNVPGVTLQGIQVKDLIIGDGVGNGDVILDGVKAENLVIRGGGKNTITLKNSSFGKVSVAKPAGDVRVKGDSNTDMGEVTVKGTNGEVIFEGKATVLNVPEATKLTIQNATIQTLKTALDAKVTKGSGVYVVKTTTYTTSPDVKSDAEKAAEEAAKAASGGSVGGGGGGGGGAADTHVHNFRNGETTYATCVDRGSIVSHCTCGQSSVKYIEPTGHNFTDAPLALLDGKIVHYCQNVNRNTGVKCTEYEVIRDATPEESLTVTVAKTELLIGETMQLTADKEVVYVSNDPAVLKVAADGTVTALAAGEATVTATTVAPVIGDATISYTTGTIKVRNPMIVGEAAFTLDTIGATKQLKVTDAPLTAVWQSANTGVATVDAAGLVTAVANGKTTVTCGSDVVWTVTVNAPIYAESYKELVTGLKKDCSNGYDTTVVLTKDLTEEVQLVPTLTVSDGKTLDIRGRKLIVESLNVSNGATLLTDAGTDVTLYLTSTNTATYMDAVQASYKNSFIKLIKLGTNVDVRNIYYSDMGKENPSNNDEKDGDLSAAKSRWTFSSRGYGGYASDTYMFLWTGLPDGVTLDLNGYNFYFRALSASKFGKVIDSSAKKTGVWNACAWSGVATSYPRAFANINEGNAVPSVVNCSSAPTAATAIVDVMNIPANGKLLLPSAITSFKMNGGLLVRSGGVIETAKTVEFTAGMGIVFECATVEDLTRTGIQYATKIVLTDNIDAPEVNLTVPAGATFDCNGKILTCKTVSGIYDTAYVQNGGKIVTEDGDYVAPDTPVVFETESAMLKVGESVTLKLTNAKRAITWSVADAKVASVSGGVVTAVGAGETTVYAKYDDEIFECAIVAIPATATFVTDANSLIKELTFNAEAYVVLSADVTLTSPITIADGQTLFLHNYKLKGDYATTVEIGGKLWISSAANAGDADGTVTYLIPYADRNVDCGIGKQAKKSEVYVVVETEAQKNEVIHNIGAVWKGVRVDGAILGGVKSTMDAAMLKEVAVTLTTTKAYALEVLNTEPTDTVVWVGSDNAKVVTVDDAGALTAVDDGTATVTVTVNGQPLTCKVTVALARSLSKTTLTLSATAPTAQLTVQNLGGAAVEWSSDNEKIATVSDTGLVTAVAEGVANITAKVAGKTMTCVVTVDFNRQLNQTTVTLIKKDTTVQLEVSNLAGATVTWASDNTAVATVSASGLVTAVGEGVANITAKVAGKTLTCVVTVEFIATTKVATAAELQQAISESETDIELTADVSFGTDSFTVPSGTTVYLAGHTLSATGLYVKGTVEKNGGKLAWLVCEPTSYSAGTAKDNPKHALTALNAVNADGAASPIDYIRLTGKVDVAHSQDTSVFAAGGALENVANSSDYPKVNIKNETTKFDLNGQRMTITSVTQTMHEDFVDTSADHSGELWMRTWDSDSGADATATPNISENSRWTSSVKYMRENPKVTRVFNISAAMTTDGDYDFVIPEDAILDITTAGIKPVDGIATTMTVESGATIRGSKELTIPKIVFECATAADFTRTGIDRATEIRLTADITDETLSFAVPNGVSFDCNGFVLTCGGFACKSADYNANGGYVMIGSTIFDPNAMVINPAMVNMTTIGETAQLSVENLGSKTVDEWRSGNAAVATVSDTGLVTAVDEGETTITAKVGTRTLTATVKIALDRSLDLTSVKLITAGATQQLTVVNNGTAAISWKSDDTSVATVSATGLVTAVANGTATITATIGETKLTCAVTVEIVETTKVATAAELNQAITDGKTKIELTADINLGAELDIPADTTVYLQGHLLTVNDLITVDDTADIETGAGGSVTILLTSNNTFKYLDAVQATADHEAVKTVKLGVDITAAAMNYVDGDVDGDGPIPGGVKPADNTAESAFKAAFKDRWPYSYDVYSVYFSSSGAYVWFGVPEGSVLDLNGHKFTARALSNDDFGKVIDSSEGKVGMLTMNAWDGVYAAYNRAPTYAVNMDPEVCYRMHYTGMPTTPERIPGVVVVGPNSILSFSAGDLVIDGGYLFKSGATMTEDASKKSFTTGMGIVFECETAEDFARIGMDKATTIKLNADLTDTALTFSVPEGVKFDCNGYTLTCGGFVCKSADYVKNGGKVIVGGAEFDPDKMTVNPASCDFTKIGDTKQLEVVNLGSKTVDSWASDNESVATVSASGLVTAAGEGTATITAKVGTQNLTCTVTVEIPREISSTTANLFAAGATKQLSVNDVGTNAIEWKSNNTAVATVSASGLVTAVSEGTAIITATIRGKDYTCTVTVAFAAPTTVPVTTYQELMQVVIDANNNEDKLYIADIKNSVDFTVGVYFSNHPSYATSTEANKVETYGFNVGGANKWIADEVIGWYYLNPDTNGEYYYPAPVSKHGNLTLNIAKGALLSIRPMGFYPVHTTGEGNVKISMWSNGEAIGRYATMISSSALENTGYKMMNFTGMVSASIGKNKTLTFPQDMRINASGYPIESITNRIFELGADGKYTAQAIFWATEVKIGGTSYTVTRLNAGSVDEAKDLIDANKNDPHCIIVLGTKATDTNAYLVTGLSVDDTQAVFDYANQLGGVKCKIVRASTHANNYGTKDVTLSGTTVTKGKEATEKTVFYDFDSKTAYVRNGYSDAYTLAAYAPSDWTLSYDLLTHNAGYKAISKTAFGDGKVIDLAGHAVYTTMGELCKDPTSNLKVIDSNPFHFTYGLLAIGYNTTTYSSNTARQGNTTTVKDLPTDLDASGVRVMLGVLSDGVKFDYNYNQTVNVGLNGKTLKVGTLELVNDSTISGTGVLEITDDLLTDLELPDTVKVIVPNKELTATLTSKNAWVKVATEAEKDAVLGGTGTVNGVKVCGAVYNGTDYAITAPVLNYDTYTLDRTTTTVELTVSNAVGTPVWSSDNESAATVSDGTVTAVGTGTANISAQVDGRTITCTVTVDFDAKISSETATLTTIGETKQLTLSNLGGRTVDSWASDKESVATVSASGLVTAVDEGTATITATIGGETVTCAVTVALERSLDLTSVKLIKAGATQQLTVQNNGTAAISWSSDNTAVATVDQTGVVTAVADGTATITATIGTKQLTCAVTVEIVETTKVGTAAALAQAITDGKTDIELTADVSLGADSFTVPSGTTVYLAGHTLSATGLYVNGTVEKNGGKLAWLVSEPKTYVAGTVANNPAHALNALNAVNADGANSPIDYIRITCNVDIAASSADNAAAMPNVALSSNFVKFQIKNDTTKFDLNGYRMTVTSVTQTMHEDFVDTSADHSGELWMRQWDSSDTTSINTSENDRWTKSVSYLRLNSAVQGVIWIGGTMTTDGNYDFVVPAGVILDISNNSIKPNTGIVTTMTLETGATIRGSKELTVPTIVFECETAADFTRAGIEKATELKLMADLTDETLSIEIPNGVKFNCNGYTLTCGGFICKSADYVPNGGKVMIGDTEFDPDAMSMNPATATLTTIGETVQLAIENLGSKTVSSWVSDNESVATVSAAGLVTAVDEGEATITATIGGETVTCAVTVALERSLDLTSVKLIKVGATQKLTVQNNGTASISWSSDNTAVATVDQTGVVTAVADGTATITATIGTKQLTCAVTVEIVETTKVATAAELTQAITDGKTEIELTADIDFGAELTVPADTTVYLQGHTLTVNNLITVNATASIETGANGGVTILLTSGNSYKYMSAQQRASELDAVNVIKLGADIPLSNITYADGGYADINSSDATEKAAREALAKTLFPYSCDKYTPYTGSSYHFMWTGMPEGVALDLNGHRFTTRAFAKNVPFGTVIDSSTGKTGVFDAVAWHGVTHSYMQAAKYSDEGNDVQYIVDYTSAPDEPSDVTEAMIIGEGAVLKFSANVAVNGGYTFKSGATIDSSKKLNAAGGVVFECATAADLTRAGIAQATEIKLTANVTDNTLSVSVPEGVKFNCNGYTLTCGGFVCKSADYVKNGGKVIVGGAEFDPDAMSMNPATYEFTALSATKQLEIVNLGGRTVDSWVSDNESVATVSASGLVTAVGEGTATITAKVGAVDLTCAVTVEIPREISDTTVNLFSIGATKQLSVSDVGSNPITWKSDNESVATVSASGLVTAVAEGTATITATIRGKDYTCAVTIVVAQTVTVPVTNFQELMQTVVDANNNADKVYVADIKNSVDFTAGVYFSNHDKYATSTDANKVETYGFEVGGANKWIADEVIGWFYSNNGQDYYYPAPVSKHGNLTLNIAKGANLSIRPMGFYPIHTTGEGNVRVSMWSNSDAMKRFDNMLPSSALENTGYKMLNFTAYVSAGNGAGKTLTIPSDMRYNTQEYASEKVENRIFELKADGKYTAQAIAWATAVKIGGATYDVTRLLAGSVEEAKDLIDANKNDPHCIIDLGTKATGTNAYVVTGLTTTDTKAVFDYALAQNAKCKITRSDSHSVNYSGANSTVGSATVEASKESFSKTVFYDFDTKTAYVRNGYADAVMLGRYAPHDWVMSYELLTYNAGYVLTVAEDYGADKVIDVAGHAIYTTPNKICAAACTNFKVIDSDLFRMGYGQLCFGYNTTATKDNANPQGNLTSPVKLATDVDASGVRVVLGATEATSYGNKYDQTVNMDLNGKTLKVGTLESANTSTISGTGVLEITDDLLMSLELPDTVKVIVPNKELTGTLTNGNTWVKVATEAEKDAVLAGAGTYNGIAVCGAILNGVEYAPVVPTLNYSYYSLNRTTSSIILTIDNAVGTPVWSSDNESAATVSDGTVTAVGTGTANITAQVDGKTLTCAVTVDFDATISDEAVTLTTIGATKQLTLGNATGAVVEWTSGDPTVATVSNDGLVTAVANGEAVITASIGSQNLTCTVTVAAYASTDVATAAELQQAISESKPNIKLTADIDLGAETISLAANQILHLNGKTLTVADSITVNGTVEAEDGQVVILLTEANGAKILDQMEYARTHTFVKTLKLGVDYLAAELPYTECGGDYTKSTAKELANARWPYNASKYTYMNLTDTYFWVWMGLPDGVTLDLNGHTYLVRPVADGFGSVIDSSTGKTGLLQLQMWNGVADSFTRAWALTKNADIKAQIKLNATSVPLVGKNAQPSSFTDIYTIGAGTNMHNTQTTFNIDGGLVFETGATYTSDATSVITAGKGVVFECATVADFTRAGIDQATEIKLVGSITDDAAEITIPATAKFNCNGYTLTCKSFTYEGILFEANEGKVITEDGEFVPSSATKVATAAELTQAVTDGATLVELTDDIDLGTTAFKLPATMILDLAGHTLKMTNPAVDSFNNGTVSDSKQTGKLLFKLSSSTSYKYFDAVEASYHAGAKTTIQLGTTVDATTVSTTAVSGVSTKDAAIARWTYSKTGYTGYVSGTSIWLWAGIPSNATLDLNGYTLKFRAFAASFGGDVIDSSSAKSGILQGNFWGGVDKTLGNVAKLAAGVEENGISFLANCTSATDKTSQKWNAMTDAIYYPGNMEWKIPTSTTNLYYAGKITFASGCKISGGKTTFTFADVTGGVTFECADEADLKRSYIGASDNVTIKLMKDITLTGDVNVGKATVNLNGHTVTGGQLVNS